MFADGMNIKGFHFSSDLSKVAVFDTDVVQCWTIDNVDSGKATLVSEAVSHIEEISSVMLSNDGKYVVSGDVRGGVNVSNFETGKRTGGVRGFKTAVVDIVARADEGFVVMDRHGVANGSSKTTRDKITPFGTTVSNSAVLSANGNRIAYQSGSEVHVADVHSHKIIGTIKPKNRPQSMRFSQHQKYLLLKETNLVSVWNWRKAERVRVFRNGSNSIRPTVPMAVFKDDTSVVVVTGDAMNQISVFEMPN